jgi:hypothetical protein
LPLWQYLEAGGKRAVAVWHRRAGKDLLAINWIASQMMQRVGLYWHLLPTYQQGRKIVWNGRTKEGRPFLDAFPPELVISKNHTDMRLTLKSPNPDFSEGSVYQVIGTDDVDRLVGSNPVGCVFSEYSLQDPRAYEYILPILIENGGWALFIYTPRGDNHGRDMYEMAQKNAGWFCQKLVAGSDGTRREDGTPVVSDEQIAEVRGQGYSEAMIQQEFFCSFETPVEGSYYGTQMRQMVNDKRIANVPWEPTLEVHTAWDLGVNDMTTIVFFQQVANEVRIIDYYENSGEGIAHYVKRLREKDYVYGRHLAPWDIEIRELTTGKTRKEVAKMLGINFTTVQKVSVEDGIEAVRNVLPRCWIDQDKCVTLIRALREYHKELDEKRKVYKNNPTHDWSSHPCDAMRYLAVGLKKDMGRNKKLPEFADMDYAIFAR